MRRGIPEKLYTDRGETLRKRFLGQNRGINLFHLVHRPSVEALSLESKSPPPHGGEPDF